MTATDVPSKTTIAREHDESGVSLLRSLGRVFEDRFSIGSIRALVVGLLTLGIVPFFGMARRFRDYVTFERQQMVHLADWLRRHHDSRETEQLQDLSRRLRFREGLHGLGLFLTMFVLAMLVLWAMPLSVQHLIGETYGARPWEHSSAHEFHVSMVWNIALCVVYLLHWLQVSIYMAEAKRFVDQFNVVASQIGLKTVQNPAPRGTFMWAIVAVVFVWFGAFWGIPLAVAGMTQRAYVARTAPRTRKELAESMRQLLMQRREGRIGPDYRVHLAKCAEPLCQSPLPIGSMYCPRCGKPIAPTVHHA